MDHHKDGAAAAASAQQLAAVKELVKAGKIRPEIFEQLQGLHAQDLESVPVLGSGQGSVDEYHEKSNNFDERNEASSFRMQSKDSRNSIVQKSMEAKLAIIGALRMQFLFAELSYKEISSVVDVMEKLEVAKGHEFLRGDSQFYVVEAGKFRVSGEGGESSSIITDGGSFNNLALLNDEVAGGSSVATDTSSILAVAMATSILWVLDCPSYRNALASIKGCDFDEMTGTVPPEERLERLQDEALSHTLSYPLISSLVSSSGAGQQVYRDGIRMLKLLEGMNASVEKLKASGKMEEAAALEIVAQKADRVLKHVEASGSLVLCAQMSVKVKNSIIDLWPLLSCEYNLSSRAFNSGSGSSASLSTGAQHQLPDVVVTDVANRWGKRQHRFNLTTAASSIAASRPPSITPVCSFGGAGANGVSEGGRVVVALGASSKQEKAKWMAVLETEEERRTREEWEAEERVWSVCLVRRMVSVSLEGESKAADDVLAAVTEARGVLEQASGAGLAVAAAVDTGMVRALVGLISADNRRSRGGSGGGGNGGDDGGMDTVPHVAREALPCLAIILASDHSDIVDGAREQAVEAEVMSHITRVMVSAQQYQEQRQEQDDDKEKGKDREDEDGMLVACCRIVTAVCAGCVQAVLDAEGLVALLLRLMAVGSTTSVSLVSAPAPAALALAPALARANRIAREATLAVLAVAAAVAEGVGQVEDGKGGDKTEGKGVSPAAVDAFIHGLCALLSHTDASLVHTAVDALLAMVSKDLNAKGVAEQMEAAGVLSALEQEQQPQQSGRSADFRDLTRRKGAAWLLHLTRAVLARTSLAKLEVNRAVQARSLRVLVAGHPQMRLEVKDVHGNFLGEEAVLFYQPEFILMALNAQHPELGLPTCTGGKVKGHEVQYHEKVGELGTPPYRALSNDPIWDKAKQAELYCGAKVRVVRSGGNAGVGERSGSAGGRRPLEARGVRISTVKRFHEDHPGDNSRAKQHQMLANVQVQVWERTGTGATTDTGVGAISADEKYDDGCAYGRMKPGELPLEFVAGVQYAIWLYPGFEHNKSFPEKSKRLIDGKHLRPNPKRCDEALSWVEWAAADDAGPADFMISYSWSLNWAYLIVFMEAVFGPSVRVWIDILACGQHQIEQGAMDEIGLLPEVLDYTGKTVVMPGTAARMWCNYEFGWSVELNSKQLFYADFRALSDGLKETVEAQLSPDLLRDVDALVKCDKRLLALPGALLLEYPDVDVDVEAVDELDAATDGTKGAFLAAKPSEEGMLLTGRYKVLMYKSAKELEVAGSALKLCGRCWKQSDEDYIRGTIQNRLGGKIQVCLITKEAFGVQSGGVTATAIAAAVELPKDATEVEILTRFFMDSKGPEWKNKEKWCDNEVPVAEWFGVGVAADGCVTSLDLPHNGITFVAVVVSRLARLRTVNLRENSTLDAKSIADAMKASE
jgi:hypothetical protein